MLFLAMVEKKIMPDKFFKCDWCKNYTPLNLKRIVKIAQQQNWEIKNWCPKCYQKATSHYKITQIETNQDKNKIDLVKLLNSGKAKIIK